MKTNYGEFCKNVGKRKMYARQDASKIIQKQFKSQWSDPCTFLPKIPIRASRTRNVTLILSRVQK